MLELVHRIPQTQASGLVLQKLIDNRSKCYKQLADLSNLKQSGLLSDAEYASEREAIMSMLKKLSKNSKLHDTGIHMTHGH